MIEQFTAWAIVFAESPVVRSVQAALVCVAAIHIYVVLYVLRDVFLRTRSTALQIGYLLMVGLLPGVGFLIYLLLRPAETLFMRRLLFLLEHTTLRKHVRRHTARTLQKIKSAVRPPESKV